MKRLTDTVSAEGIAMAETNARLSQVHVDLKNAFQKMRVRKNYRRKVYLWQLIQGELYFL